jgi:hypothetical protein
MKLILATIIFALDVWAIASIINTNESNGTKLIWILLVALLPVLGLIIWWFAGPKANYSN